MYELIQIKFVKICLQKINAIYYYIPQKCNRLDRQEHNTADKSRGYDRTSEGRGRRMRRASCFSMF